MVYAPVLNSYWLVGYRITIVLHFMIQRGVMTRKPARLLVTAVASILAFAVVSPGTAVAATQSTDSFYSYSGSEPLSSFAPGTA